MDTTIPRPRTIAQPRTSTLAKLTAAALAGISTTFGYMQLFVIGFDPMVAAAGAVLLVVAGLIFAGWRWIPALGALLTLLLAGGLLAPAFDQIIAEIVTPGMPLRVALTILLPLMVVAIVAGVGAAVQNYRRAPEARRAPRWLFSTLAVVTGVVVGAILLGSVVRAAASASVSPQTLAMLPSVLTKDMAFAQTEIRVKAGQVVALRLENADTLSHSFDVDEFDIHAQIPAGESSVAVFQPTKPGAYTFYCAPHYNKQTGEGMRGALIVE
jgi:plastocyanin